MKDIETSPCYGNNKCGSVYNCGPNTVDCPSVRECGNILNGESECYGLDPGTCSGILSRCDVNDPVLRCDGEFNMSEGGARNPQGNRLGCDIASEGIASEASGSLGSRVSECVEFKNTVDGVVDCSGECWSSGGHSVVKDKCESIGTEAECRGLSYFCDWVGGSCDARGSDRSLLEQYKERMGGVGPAGTRMVLLSRDCESNENTFCEKVEDVNYKNDKIAYCAQSNTNSRMKTSLDENTQICCVENLDGTDRKCITNPRCVFVGSTSECGSLDNISWSNSVGDHYRFMCSDVMGFNNGVMYSGYCTWCSGIQTERKFVMPAERVKELASVGVMAVTRNDVYWNTGQRCSNYNECEVEESERMWNSCIWEVSGGRQGVDPVVLEGRGSEEVMGLLREGGYCSDKDSVESVGYREECEKRLESLGSIQYGRVISPTGGNVNLEIPACNYKYNWVHMCTRATDGEGREVRYTKNYLCTWCRDLQCKRGSEKEICSRVVKGAESFDKLGMAGTFCDTDSSHGEILPRVGEYDIPSNCGCYLGRVDGGKDINAVIVSSAVSVIIVVLSVLLIIFV